MMKVPAPRDGNSLPFGAPASPKAMGGGGAKEEGGEVREGEVREAGGRRSEGKGMRGK